MDDAEFSQLHNPYTATIDLGGGDKFCQWSIQETQDFLVIRGELDPTFMETKRNKLLWELVSTRMKQIRYTRSPQQCKSKWKNLVTRYKGCETMEEEEMRQETFPFYNQMQFIFNARMQRMLWLEAGGGGDSGGAASRQQQPVVQISSDDERRGGRKRKRKKKGAIVDGLKEIMEELMKQQMEMEMQWIRVYEEREERRRVREMEWRQRMEALENERLMMMNWWREREEQWKMREEARADTRDAHLTALFNKLTRDLEGV